MAVVIFGPMATGKTYHASRFAQHYGCDRVVEAENRGRQAQPLRDTDLVLTYVDSATAKRRYPDAKRVPIDDARKAIGLLAAPAGGFCQPYDQAPGWYGSDIRPAQTRAATVPLNSETIVAANVFLGHMADRYLHHMPHIQAITAMEFALPAFDALIEREAFGAAPLAWNKAHAISVVDANVSQWGGVIQWPTPTI